MKRRPMRFLPPLLASLLLSVPILASCECPPFASCPGPSAQGVTLLLGFRPDVQFAPFYVAQQEGLYADAGLSVTIEHRQSPDVIRLVAAGQAEFGVADATDVMISRSQGITLRYVATLYEQFPVAIIGPAGEVPSDPAGLAGRRIGTPGRFGSSWHALLALLDAAGLEGGDVEIREYPQFNQAEGLLAGDVELITGFRNNEPLRLEAAGMVPELLTLDEVAPLPGPGIVVGDALLRDRPELVEAFVTATLDGLLSVIGDVDRGLRAAEEAVPAIAEDRQTARAVLEATLELWRTEGGAVGRVDLDRWEEALAIMRRLGFVTEQVTVDEMTTQLVPDG